MPEFLLVSQKLCQTPRAALATFLHFCLTGRWAAALAHAVQHFDTQSARTQSAPLLSKPFGRQPCWTVSTQTREAGAEKRRATRGGTFVPRMCSLSLRLQPITIVSCIACVRVSRIFMDSCLMMGSKSEFSLFATIENHSNTQCEAMVQAMQRHVPERVGEFASL